MTKQVRGTKSPITLRRILTTAAVLLLFALVLVAPAAAENWIDEPDTSWYNTENAEFTIDTAAKLAGLAAIVNGNAGNIAQDSFTNKKITLGANIDLKDKEWTPIGGTTYTFKGEFNGAGYTISNIKDTSNAKYKGLFARAREGFYIHNLNIQGVEFSSTEAVSDVQIGTLGGGATNYAVLTDITVKDVEINYPQSTDGYFGGLIGEALMYSQAKDITVENVKITVGGSGNEIAGINPKAQGNAQTTGDKFSTQTHWIEGATFTASIGDTSPRILNGYYDNVDVKGLTIIATGDAEIGGLSAFTASGNAGWSSFYHNCDVTGLSITCNGNSKFTVGGLVGSSAGGDNAGAGGSGKLSVNGFEKCTVTGTITASQSTADSAFGGFFATKTSSGTTIKDCKSNVAINAGAGNAGGFIGQVKSMQEGRIMELTGCENTGAITITGNAGGFVGELQEQGGSPIQFTVTNCKSTGDVTGGTYAAGFVGHYLVGQLSDTVTFTISKDCSSTGTLSASVTDDIINVPYQYYKVDDTTNNVWTVGQSQAYVLQNGVKVGYATIAAALETNADNVNLLHDDTTGFTIDRSEGSTFTLNLNDDGVSRATIKATITIPNDITLIIKGAPDKYESNSIVLSTPSKEGYTCVGWYTADNVQVQDNTVTSVSDDGTTYHAEWTYTITFDGNGSPDTMEAQTVTLGDEATTTLTSNTFTRTGYTFDAWNSQKDGQGAKYTDGASVPTEAGSTTLYAQWTPNKYTIYYKLNDGTAGENAPEKHTYGTETQLIDPTREGYTFGGWYTAETFADDTKVETLAAEGYTADITLYAQWEIKEVTITFKDDDGKTLYEITQNYNTPVTAPADPTKEGYIFKGWDEDIPATMPAEDMTITAQWESTNLGTTFSYTFGDPVVDVDNNKVTFPIDFKSTNENMVPTSWEVTVTVKDAEGQPYSSTPLTYTLTPASGYAYVPDDGIAQNGNKFQIQAVTTNQVPKELAGLFTVGIEGLPISAMDYTITADIRTYVYKESQSARYSDVTTEPAKIPVIAWLLEPISSNIYADEGEGVNTPWNTENNVKATLKVANLKVDKYVSTQPDVLVERGGYPLSLTKSGKVTITKVTAEGKEPVPVSDNTKTRIYEQNNVIVMEIAEADKNDALYFLIEFAGNKIGDVEYVADETDRINVLDVDYILHQAVMDEGRCALSNSNYLVYANVNQIDGVDSEDARIIYKSLDKDLDTDAESVLMYKNPANKPSTA